MQLVCRAHENLTPGNCIGGELLPEQSAGHRVPRCHLTVTLALASRCLFGVRKTLKMKAEFVALVAALMPEARAKERAGGHLTPQDHENWRRYGRSPNRYNRNWSYNSHTSYGCFNDGSDGIGGVRFGSGPRIGFGVE